jgi:transposase-like protein
MADPDSISITCPHCGNTTTRSMSWAMTHFTTRCTECRKAFLIDRGYLLRTIQRLDAAVKVLAHRSGD